MEPMLSVNLYATKCKDGRFYIVDIREATHTELLTNSQLGGSAAALWS